MDGVETGSRELDTHLTRTLARLLGKLRRLDYRFVTPTPATIARVNARPGNETATDLGGVFGWSRPFRPDLLPAPLRDLMAEGDLLAAAGLSEFMVHHPPHPEVRGEAEPRRTHERGASFEAGLPALPDSPAPQDEEVGCFRAAVDGNLVRSRVRVSSLGPDLFVHSAFPTVSADSVFFGPDTYRFVSALDRFFVEDGRPVRRAVDIGAGAGPGGIAVARRHPGARVVLADINRTALLYADANAAAAGLSTVTSVESDLLSGVDGVFDLVVSNPPYLNDPLARAYRHGGGALGEALSLRILDEALRRLAPGGALVLYTGVAMVDGRDPFREAATDRLRNTNAAWRYREIDPDVFGEELDTDAYRGADRIAAVALTARKRT